MCNQLAAVVAHLGKARHPRWTASADSNSDWRQAQGAMEMTSIVRVTSPYGRVQYAKLMYGLTPYAALAHHYTTERAATKRAKQYQVEAMKKRIGDRPKVEVVEL